MEAHREHAWQVNADQGARQLHERVRVLEAALRPFVAAPLGYSSGIDRTGRWCSPKVRHEDMERARQALDPLTAIAPTGSSPREGT